MIAKISRGNHKWTKKYAADFEENLHDILHIQHPKVTWLTCGKLYTEIKLWNNWICRSWICQFSVCALKYVKLVHFTWFSYPTHCKCFKRGEECSRSRDSYFTPADTRQTLRQLIVTEDFFFYNLGDSRVPFSCMGIASPNEIFSVRNIGNQYKNSEGSVKYAILNLRTPIVIVMGHTGCGAIRVRITA